MTGLVYSIVMLGTVAYLHATGRDRGGIAEAGGR